MYQLQQPEKIFLDLDETVEDLEANFLPDISEENNAPLVEAPSLNQTVSFGDHWEDTSFTSSSESSTLASFVESSHPISLPPLPMPHLHLEEWCNPIESFYRENEEYFVGSNSISSPRQELICPTNHYWISPSFDQEDTNGLSSGESIFLV